MTSIISIVNVSSLVKRSRIAILSCISQYNRQFNFFITNVLIFQVFVRTRYLLRNQYLQDIVPSISLLSRLNSSDSLGKTRTTVTFSLWQPSTCLTNITANIRVKHRNVSVMPENVDGFAMIPNVI